jgi:hypothetical protein
MEASRYPWIQEPEAVETVPIDTGNEAPGRFTPFEWLAKSASLLAALLLGAIVTMGIFVVLPPPGGESRFEQRRRASEGREAVSEPRFELFGPFRNTRGSVAFSWAIAGDSLFDSYEVHFSKVPEFTPTRTTLFARPLKRPCMTSIEVTGLDCASTYYFKVRKNDRNGRFSDSGELAARTEACPDTTRFVAVDLASLYQEDEGLPGADDMNDTDPYSGNTDATSGSGDDTRAAEPIRLYPAAYVTAGSAHLIWSDDYSPGFVSYEIHVSPSAGFHPSARTQQSEFRERYRSRMVLENLECGETYYAIIRTRHADGTVLDSNTERFTTQPCGSMRPSAASLGN